jgi:hypothetical protein
MLNIRLFFKCYDYTWCGYEVPGIILLHNLKGALLLDCSKDISVHVSACTSYDFSALMPVVWHLWH